MIKYLSGIILGSFLCLVAFPRLSPENHHRDRGRQNTSVWLSATGRIGLEHLEDWIQAKSANPHLRLKKVNSVTDGSGRTHHRFYQYYQNVKIEYGMLIAHVYHDQITSINGLFLPGTIQATATAQWPLRKAKTTAVNHASLQQKNASDSDFKVSPVEQVWYLTEKGYRLAYKLDVLQLNAPYRAYIYIDANTGDILGEVSRIHTTDVTATGNTVYSGERSFLTDSITPDSFLLRNFSRGASIYTLDLNRSTSYASAVNFEDQDNYWNNINSDWDEYAADAHWGTEITYEYFLNEHGRNSIDGSGMEIKSYLHYGNNYNNAFWNGSVMTYGDGSGKPLVSIDVVGHEITHGITQYTADLVYAYESGALNESFSDIFGKAIEYYGKPDDFDWDIAGDLGSPFRSMSDPNTYGDPDTYLGDYWHTSSSDNGGVHTNSGVQNFWFYLLCEGGSGTNDLGNDFEVSALGFDTAAQIAYRNLSVYLTPNSTFEDARFYAIQSAMDLYGPCSNAVEQVTKAWYAVGVGEDWYPGVRAKFSTPDSISCFAPYTVQFKNSSQNGIKFTWHFGDGDTSHAINPEHTYQSMGTYTVKLVADGGLCGMDSVIKTSYINLHPDNPCVAKMGDPDQTACGGTLYDNGGPDANYTDDTTFTITINPPGASRVYLDFLSFAMEPGSGGTPCDYDHLEIYDGDTTTTDTLGRWCNDNGSPGLVISSGGAITITQYSDPYVNYSGFEARWTCDVPGAPPFADFETDLTEICNGQVSFMDQSYNNPQAWSWDFGDGNTSTDQHPVHIYNYSGTYTVTLIVSNGNGSDTLIKTNEITIELKDAPTLYGDTLCDLGTATLTTDNASSTIQWFDDSGQLLSTGNTYSALIDPPADFYGSELFLSKIVKGGPADSSFGDGGIFNGDQHLVFDCFEPVILKSVKVYASSAYPRTIELRRADGSIIEDTTVNLIDGEQVVDLNFRVPAGVNLQLGTPDGPQDLFRNSNGASYPYNIEDLIRIKRSSAGGDNSLLYYYFFYDWAIETYTCKSEPVPVSVEVYNEAPVEADFTHIATGNGLEISFDNLSANGLDYVWYFGDGSFSTEFAPTHTYADKGVYEVTLTVNNHCHVATYTDTLYVNYASLADPTESGVMVYPNPVSHTLSIHREDVAFEQYRIINALGQTILKGNIHASKQQIDVRTLPQGMYTLLVTGNQTSEYSFRFLIER